MLRARSVVLLAVLALALPAASAHAAPSATAAFTAFDAAQAILGGIDAGADAFTLAHAAIDARAAALGLALPILPTAAPRAPSEIVLDLLALHDVVADEAAAQGMRELDALPEPTRGALAGVLDAYLAFEAIAREEFSDPLRLDESAHHPDALQRAGVDVPSILAAQKAMLAAVQALAEAPRAASSTCTGPTVYQPPAVMIDLTSCQNTYVHDVALQIDGGGDDVYHNRAGGANAGFLLPAAALVDLGGADLYARNSGASNGGGYLGAGFLVDLAGDDDYLGGALGANGGGALGIGFLLDATGDDGYNADYGAVNGGGLGGTGLLVDASGDDIYLANGFGANGGGNAGHGLLLDGGGNDTYVGANTGSNGGGALGSGLLVDLRGNDIYLGGTGGTNGGAAGGRGLLLDLEGDDVYEAGSVAVNGGGASGVGALIDGGGNDTYRAQSSFVNGGGTGLLFDAGGRDTYEDAQGEGSGVDRTVLFEGGGAQVDWPASTSFDTGRLGPLEHTVPDEAGLEPTTIVKVGPIVLTPCGHSACRSSTPYEEVSTPRHPGGRVAEVPGAPSQPIETTGLGEVCAVLACVGPIPPFHLGDTPEIDPTPVELDPVESVRILERGELPAPCALAPAACERTTFHEGTEVTTERVGPIPTGVGGTSGVSSGGIRGEIATPSGGLHPEGPIPVHGLPFPVTLCHPTPCPVPDSGHAEAHTDAVVYVEAGGAREERTVQV